MALESPKLGKKQIETTYRILLLILTYSFLIRGTGIAQEERMG